jgi:hypothetical protein
MEPREMVPGLGTTKTSERGTATAADLPAAPVPFDDVRGFLEVVEAAGELRRLDGADWDLEIGALTELVNEQRGPALLFDHIKGYPAGYRVLSASGWATTRIRPPGWCR